MNNKTVIPRGRELDRIMEMLDASARLCAEVEATLARISALRQGRIRRIRRSAAGTPWRCASMERRP